MKHAKRMMLVEAPDEVKNDLKISVDLSKSDPESYLRSTTLFDLDEELKKILRRTDLNDREKWTKYNQTLQRFLFFINQERPNNRYNSMVRNAFNSAPNLKKGDIYNGFSMPFTNSGVKENNFTLYQNNSSDKPLRRLSSINLKPSTFNFNQPSTSSNLNNLSPIV